MTNEQHNKYVAYSFLGYAAIQSFFMLVMILMFFFMFRLGPDPGPPDGFLGIMIFFLFAMFAVFTAPAIVAAWAMLNRKEWARMAAIVAAVLSAMNAPVGTAACVYALWFWLGDNWKEVYQERRIEHYDTQGLPPRDQASAADNFRKTEQWMKGPPDWR